MANPTFVGVSATPGDSLSTSSPSIPVGTTDNDIMVLFVTTANEAISVPDGWNNTTNNVLFLGTAGTAGAVRLQVMWRRFVAGDTAPTIADVGDFHYAVIASYRGCITTGDPFNVGDGDTGSGTSVLLFGLTSTVDQCTWVHVVAGDDDSASARVSGQANASLSGITERFDAGTTTGLGGGLAIWDGTQATAGAIGNSTATITSQAWAAWMGALMPAASVAPRRSLAMTGVGV